MAEPKKRIPNWLLLCSLVLVIFATVLGFIETVGRRGTIIERYKRMTARMPEADVLTILGPPQTTKEAYFPDRALLDPLQPDDVGSAAPETLAFYFSKLTRYPLRSSDGPIVTRSYTWQGGPAEVSVVMMRRFEARYIVKLSGEVDRGAAFPNWSGGWVVAKKRLRVNDARLACFGSWRLRRWAEQGWTAIHGQPR